jgi:phosphatidylglycerol:prolipoprotein diacylglycerol transferase
MVATLAQSYVHRLDPFAIEFSEGIGLRWYGLAYAAGFVIAWLIVRWFAKTGRSPLQPQAVLDLVTYVIVGVLVGGRLGYVIFYEPKLLIDPPLLGLVQVWRGGMSSHGGIVGVIVACMLFGRRRGISSLHLLDIGALACAPGLCLGRLANFVNAELWGKALPQHMQQSPPGWSVKYPTQILERWLPLVDPRDMTPAEHADLVQTAATDFGISAPASELAGQVIVEAQRRLDEVQHQLMPLLGSGDRFFSRVVAAATDAGVQAHDQVVQAISPLLTAYYPSQIFQAISDGPILMGLLALLWLRPRKPGIIGGWFLIIYGVLRIITEHFRQPDEGVSLTFGLLSRGQSLSVLMILVGIVGLVIVARRDVPKMGGLLKPRSAM